MIHRGRRPALPFPLRPGPVFEARNSDVTVTDAEGRILRIVKPDVRWLCRQHGIRQCPRCRYVQATHSRDEEG